MLKRLVCVVALAIIVGFNSFAEVLTVKIDGVSRQFEIDKSNTMITYDMIIYVNSDYELVTEYMYSAYSTPTDRIGLTDWIPLRKTKVPQDVRAKFATREGLLKSITNNLGPLAESFLVGQWLYASVFTSDGGYRVVESSKGLYGSAISTRYLVVKITKVIR
jgi:hypothetical protein